MCRRHSLRTAFAVVAAMMCVSGALQLSLISQREWSSIASRFDLVRVSLDRQLSCGFDRIALFGDALLSRAVDGPGEKGGKLKPE